jgi:hypothetical protein
VWQTMGKLLFLSGIFRLFVTCSKAHGSGREQSSSALLIPSSSCLQESSKATSISFTSSSKGRRGPISRLGLLGFSPEAVDWTVKDA